YSTEYFSLDVPLVVGGLPRDVLWRYRVLIELEDEMGDAHMAIQAKLMSQAFHKLSHSLSLRQKLIIFINHESNTFCIRRIWKSNTSVCYLHCFIFSGNILKFYASYISKYQVKKGEELKI
ncbi:hypothetical protein HID58_020528, partial [Brassica napus]